MSNNVIRFGTMFIFILIGLTGLSAVSAAPNNLLMTTYIVNDDGDFPDHNIGDGSCDWDSVTAGDQCTLRAAIEEANSDTAHDTIQFSVGLPAILPATALPVISFPLTIDGVTGNSLCPTSGSPGNMSIILNGFLLGALAKGLHFGPSSDGSELKGLSINNFPGDGIFIQADNVVVQCNHIGVDGAGTLAQGNNQGINLEGDNNIIGGSNIAERNVISSNSRLGIRAFGSNGNIFLGNYIGTDATGLNPLGNGLTGLVLSGSSSNIIGGIGNNEGNIFAFNGNRGVQISHFVTLDAIENTVRGNSFFGNAGLGIDLQGDAVTPMTVWMPMEPLRAIGCKLPCAFSCDHRGGRLNQRCISKSGEQ